MSVTGAMTCGPSYRYARTRGRISGGIQDGGLTYPSPFFDIAHTWLPASIKRMFRWCRYYFFTNPLINATVFKLSEYPITDIVIDHDRPEVVSRWTEYLQDHLRIRPFQVECGLDYHTFGACAVSISYPFKKYLVCKTCGFTERADKIREHYRMRNFQFLLSCPRCGSTEEADAHDFYYRDASGIKLMRWNIEDLDVRYNELTGESTYYYTIPQSVKSDISIGKKDVVETTPQRFMQALQKNKGIKFSENFFFFKRPSLGGRDRGWGMPLLMPVLKDTFYLQVMKKAQEAILLEHIVPLRVLFPQAGSGTSDPYTTINLSKWKDHIATEIARWRMDPNYIPILPLPIGQQTLGGDGRALLMTQEMQIHSEQILGGMGVPKELIFGGLSYSGSNVSLRIMENTFIGYLTRHTQFLRWVIREVSNYMRWPLVKARFKPFKMADDLQRKALLFQYNQAQKLSDTTLLSDSDLSQQEEDELMVQETEKRLESTRKQQLAMAEVQAESQLIMSKAQVKAQQAAMEAQAAPQAPGEPGGPEAGGGTAGGQQVGGAPPGAEMAMSSPLDMGQRMGPEQSPEGTGVDIVAMAQQLAQQLSQMPPDQQQTALQTIAAQSPELAQMVEQMLSQMGGAEGGAPQGAPAGVDMRPNPEVLPPRRETPAI